MLNVSCLCGNVRIAIEKRPDYLHECNCTLCRKTGARWGNFHPSEISVDGRTEGYCREDKTAPNAEVKFCPGCGATTHFVLTEDAVSRFGNSLMGVNLWLAEPQDIAGLELRYPDGANWSGEGEFAYVREARTLG